MDQISWLQAIPGIGASAGLVLIVVWSRDGTIRWGKAVDELIAAINKAWTDQVAALNKSWGDQVAALQTQNAQLRADLEQERKDQAAESDRLLERNDRTWHMLEDSITTARRTSAVAAAALSPLEDAAQEPESPLHPTSRTTRR